MYTAYLEDSRIYIAEAIQKANLREQRIKRIVNWEDRNVTQEVVLPKENPTHFKVVRSIGMWNFIKSLRP